MASTKEFLSALGLGLQNLVAGTLKPYARQATADGQAFLDAQKLGFRKWTQQLVSGELSKADFTDLVAGVQDLAELVALKQAGLAAAKLDQFRADLVNLVVDTAFKVYLP